MASEIVWSKRARDALLEIYVAIGLENPAAAERIYDRIETHVNRLARHPRIGPRRSDIRPSVRMLVERPYLILYETNPDTDDGPVAAVDIINVVDGRRDLSQIY